MGTELSDELYLLQLSRSAMKYKDMLDEYVQEIPDRVNRSVTRPIGYMNSHVSSLFKNRGRMLYILDKRLNRSMSKLRRITERLRTYMK